MFWFQPVMAVVSMGLAWVAFRSRHPSKYRQTMLTFLPDMAVSENGIQLAALQCLLALLAVKRLRGGHVPSKALVGLTLASTLVSAGNAVSALSDNLRARRVFIDAFRTVNIQTKALTSSQTASRQLASVFPLLPLLSFGIKVKRGVCYNRTAKTALKLDVYWNGSNDPPVRRPCFLYIHGGGWVAGHRQIASLPLLYDLARAGFVVFTIDYRLSPLVAFPGHLVDCKRALAWIKANASAFGGDPDFVMVGGESAGGHLSMMLAMTPNEAVYQNGFEDTDTTVNGCIDLYGAHDLTDANDEFQQRDLKGEFRFFIARMVMQRKYAKAKELFQKASPYWLVQHALTTHVQVPPVMSVHGELDTLIPINDARHFVRELGKLRAAKPSSHPDVYVELPGCHHAFNYLVSPRTLALGDAVVDFCTSVHQKWQQQRAGESKL